MRTRKLWTLGGIAALIAVAFIAGHGALANPGADPVFENEQLGLVALDPVFTAGAETPLEVSVGPTAIGGYAHLYAEVDGVAEHISDFQINEPVFTIQATVPNIPAPATIAFYYEAFNALAMPLGTSKKPEGYLEPDFE